MLKLFLLKKISLIDKFRSLIFSNKNNMQTYFGIIKSEVSVFPLIYLFLVYSSRLITWEIWNNLTIYNLWSHHEHLAEHMQFVFYLSSSLLSIFIILKNKYKLFSFQNLCWLCFLILVSIIAIEEISYIYSIQNNLFLIIRENNSQNEINFHNSFLFQPLLNKGFIFLNLFFGWFGWRFFSIIEAIPKKEFSLYFLCTSLAYSIMELTDFSIFSNLKIIPIRQENFEFLMAMGLFLHSLKIFNYYSKRDY